MGDCTLAGSSARLFYPFVVKAAYMRKRKEKKRKNTRCGLLYGQTVGGETAPLKRGCRVEGGLMTVVRVDVSLRAGVRVEPRGGGEVPRDLQGVREQILRHHPRESRHGLHQPTQRRGPFSRPLVRSRSQLDSRRFKLKGGVYMHAYIHVVVFTYTPPGHGSAPVHGTVRD